MAIYYKAKHKAKASKSSIWKKDVDIEFLLVGCEFGKFDLKEVEKKLMDFNFNTLINRLPLLLSHK